MSKCHVCGKGPLSSPPVTVYRQNPKGEAGVWACREHNTQPIEPEVEQVVDAIESDMDGFPIHPEPRAAYAEPDEEPEGTYNRSEYGSWFHRHGAHISYATEPGYETSGPEGERGVTGVHKGDL